MTTESLISKRRIGRFIEDVKGTHNGFMTTKINCWSYKEKDLKESIRKIIQRIETEDWEDDSDVIQIIKEEVGAGLI